jgi:hypothetical protein
MVRLSAGVMTRGGDIGRRGMPYFADRLQTFAMAFVGFTATDVLLAYQIIGAVFRT